MTWRLHCSVDNSIVHRGQDRGGYPSFQFRFFACGFPTLNCLRPFFRRCFKILRPLLVDRRARKPCVRFRFRFLGWYVRFGMSSSFTDEKHENDYPPAIAL
jgi:hypothetical protein